MVIWEPNLPFDTDFLLVINQWEPYACEVKAWFFMFILF